MRQTLSKGMVAAAAATSILSLYGSQAFADSDVHGVAADSPGVLSGNNVQAPVGVPVNACGNSANAAAGLNPSFGNSCATPTGKHRKPDGPRHGAPAGYGSDHGHGSHQGYGSDHGGGSGHHGSGHHGGGHHGDGSSTHGGTHHAPGVGSGNLDEAPVHAPANACGDAADAGGLLNPAFGARCGHDGPKGYGDDDTPPSGPPSEPPSGPPHTTPPSTTPPTTTPPETGPPGTVPPTTGPPSSVPPTTGPPSSVPPTTGPGAPHPSPPSSGQGPWPELAATGVDGMLAASAAGAGLLLGGAILYRRNRAASRR
ncbi:chaplin family protein [Streptomyces sp. NPDC017991]|uniref:chaplin n=1 Tax=Streptomyces sp. NPDC017991 TaxID=3365026 RepID=UPI00379383B1